MKFVLHILFFIYSTTLFGQINFAKESDYKDFMQSKTLVVLDPNSFSLYNETIKKAVESFWKITPYEFISTKEFNVRKSNKNFSFLMLTEASLAQKGVTMQYNMLNLIMGGKYKNINDMPDLGSVPLSYTEVDEENYLYKLGGVLQFMQFFVNYNLNNPNTDIFKLVKNIDGKIGKKEIWLIKDEVDININTTEKVRAIYNGVVKFASKEEIAEAIIKKNSNVVFLHKIGNSKNGNICWKFLIDAGTGKPVYFSQHKVDKNHPDTFGIEDFKNLN